MNNILPQRFLVQVLEIGDEVNLVPFPLDDSNDGTLTVTGLGNNLNRVVIIVSGLTPVTTQPANYSYTITAIE